MRRSIMICICLFGSLLAFAQKETIRGRILGPDGAPIAGASVKVKNSNKGAVTQDDGSFVLKADGNVVLIVSALGYDAKQMNADNTHPLEVRLERNNKSMEEVVVTAVGIKREKRDLTFSSQEVKGDELVRAKEPNLLNAMTGKVSGVQITNSTGTPGGSARIVIRGATSLLGNNQALIVMDGVPINNDETGATPDGGPGTDRLSDIDPSTVESINVLKGAAATALYGSAGARGVVLITTKKGVEGNLKPQINFSSEASLDYAIYPERQMKYAQGDLGIYYTGAPGDQTSSSWGPAIDTLTYNGQKVQFHNPFKEFFKVGKTTNNTVSVAGGGTNSGYFMSYSYYDQHGTVPDDDYIRNSVFSKYTTKIIDHLTATVQVAYTYGTVHKLPEGYGLTSPQVTVETMPISYDPLPYENSDGTQRLYRASRNNPYWLVHNELNTSVVNRVVPIVNVNYAPLPWLSVTERLGGDIITDQTDFHVNTGDIAHGTGYIQNDREYRRQLNNDLIVQGHKQFGKWNTNLTLGTNLLTQYSETGYANGTNLSIPGYYNINNASSVNYYNYFTQTRKIGVYAEADLDYDKWLVLALTGREDGSSVLEKEWYPYGSAALGLIFSEWLPAGLRHAISFGKARVSVAEVGNDNVGAYVNQTGYNQASIGGYINTFTFPYNGQNGFTINQTLGNASLVNELQKETEAGLEMKFLDNRIGFEASYFDRHMTKGLINGAAVSNATGYTGTTLNSAQMTTNGVEALVNVTPVKTRNFSWDMTLNFSKINNKVTYIAPGITNTDIGFVYAIVGQPWGALYGSKFARTADGQLKINSSGLPYNDPSDPNGIGVVGNISPNWTGGITNSFRYKNWGLSFFIDIKKGGEINNTSDYYGMFYGTSIQTQNRQDRVVAGISDATGKANTQVVTAENYFRALQPVYESQIQNDSYTKLRNVSLSYSLGHDVLAHTALREVTFIVTGKNLIIWKGNFTGGDPEVNSWGGQNNNVGNYSYSTPTNRTVDFTLRVGF